MWRANKLKYLFTLQITAHKLTQGVSKKCNSLRSWFLDANLSVRVSKWIWTDHSLVAES
jgi:hypothetical protein